MSVTIPAHLIFYFDLGGLLRPVPGAPLLLGTTCFLSFAWAIRGHFAQQDRMPQGMRIVSILSLVGLLWFLLDSIANTSAGNSLKTVPSVVASVLFVLSLLIFWWSIRATRSRPLTLAFAPDIPGFLQHQGPYRYVRHPFYLSYLLFWIGTAAASVAPWHWAMPVVMGVLYAVAARREERKFDASELAAAYQAYRQRTGMLLPRFRRQADEMR
jgi:protein-S-isoprenylcysteine O-methyltransferase Ste14